MVYDDQLARFAVCSGYGAANRVMGAVDQEGLSVTRTLDLDGKPRTVTDPNGNVTSFEYYGPDKHGRLKLRREPAAQAGQTCTTGQTGQAGQTCLETVYDYDAVGNVSTVTVYPVGGGSTQETRTAYDALNRPTRVVGPVFTDGGTGQQQRPVTCVSYNLLGFRTNVRVGASTDLAEGATPACPELALQMSYGWDDFGRKLRETDALGRSWVTTYDVHNNPLTVIDPKLQQTTLTWAYGHQMLTRTAAGQATRWTRNDLGQVLQVFQPDPTALYTYTYDAMHRPASVTDHRGQKMLTYGYSPGGLLNFVEDSEGNRTDYVYDGSGRLAQVWAPNGDVAAYAYDAGGRLAEKWLPNGVSARYAWNGDNTLASLTNRHGATAVSAHTYSYDGFRNRRTHTETVAGTTTPYRYTYDNLNRLIRVDNDTTLALIESYEYDVLGNRTKKTDSAWAATAFVYDAVNQLTEGWQGGSRVLGFVYDLNGNVTKKCEGGTVTRSEATCDGATVSTLTYDALNRLSQVDKTGLATQTYAYDDQGRRVQKSVGGVVTNYLYNGEDIHATFGASWTTATARHTHGPGTDNPILRTGETTTHYFHADGLGSIVALTSDTGVIDASTRYDAWGNRIAPTGSLPIYGYTGREPDETGLIYYRARYYDPVVGRFTQRDPVGLAGGLNAYAYAWGSPTNLVDRRGLTPDDPVAVATALILGTYVADVPAGPTAAAQTLRFVAVFQGGPSSSGPNGSSESDLNRGLKQIVRDLEQYGPEGIMATTYNSGQAGIAARDASIFAGWGFSINAIGFSFGGSEATRFAQLVGVRIDVLITIDSIARGFTENNNVISSNVGTNLHFYQQDTWLLSGRPNEAANPATTTVINTLIPNTNHWDITLDPVVAGAVNRAFPVDRP